jgi:Uma2 family endonuclease
MAEPRLKPMTWDAYLEWEETQPVRYELINGEVYAMGGGTAAHDRIGNRLRSGLETTLRGRSCRPHGPDMKVQTGSGNGRYPDALIDCGRFVPTALQAQEPTAVFEVLSRSTAWKDQNEKFDDYDATPTIKHYVLIFQDEIRAMIYTRTDNGVLDRGVAIVLRSLDEHIALPGSEITLPMALLYEGMEFDSAAAA